MTTFSPASAETGTTRTGGSPTSSARARKSASTARKARSSQSARSILFTTRTTCGTRSTAVTAAWRRVCGVIPLRTSTSSSAASAVEAPVTMLRVYCAWPGVSISTNDRFGVVK